MSNRYIPTLNYTEIDREQIVKRVGERLVADGFGNLLDSKKISLLVDIFGEAVDFVLYYLERRAEENYYDVARLEATAPLLANNYGYTMRRPVPAKAPMSIRIQGKTGTPSLVGYEMSIPMFSRLDFNGIPFISDRTYVYTFTSDDEPDNSDWSKTFTFAVMENERFVLKTDDDKTAVDGQGELLYPVNSRYILSFVQGEFREMVIDHLSNPIAGQIFQRYTLDDPEFSNYFGKEDPNAYSPSTGEMNLGAGYTKVSVCFPEGNITPFLESSLYTIDRRSLISHDTLYRDTWDKFYDEYGNLIEDQIPRVCVLRTDRDGGVNLIFGDGLISAYPGSTQDIHIRYLATRGEKANKIGVVGETMSFVDQVYASGPTGTIRLTGSMVAPLLGNITGGSNLESIESVRVNAPSVFNSFDRLIGLGDYTSFLRSQVSPLIVRQAIAWGENEEARAAGRRAIHRFANHVFFSAIGSMYLRREDGSFAPKDHIPNPTTPDQETLAFQNGTYLESFDFDVISQSSFFNALVADRVVQQQDEERILYEQFFNRTNPPYTEQQVEMVDRFPYGHPVMQVGVALEKRGQLTVHHQYISPIIQKFFLDGDVVIRDFAAIDQVRSRLDTKIYQYLDNSINFNTPIYLSQMVDIIKSDPDVSYCNIKFTPRASDGDMITDWMLEPEFNANIPLTHLGLFAEPQPASTNQLYILPDPSGYFDSQGIFTVNNFQNLVGQYVRVSKDNGQTWQYTEILEAVRSQNTANIRSIAGFVTQYHYVESPAPPDPNQVYLGNMYMSGAFYIVAPPYDVDVTKIGQIYHYESGCYVNGPCYGPDNYELPAIGTVAKVGGRRASLDTTEEYAYYQFNGITWVEIPEVPYVYTIKIDTSEIGPLDPSSSSTMIEVATNFHEVCDALGFQPKYYLIEGFREAIRKEVQRLFDIVLCKECTSCPTTGTTGTGTTQLDWYGKCVPLVAARDFMPRTVNDAGPCRQVHERMDWNTYYGSRYKAEHPDEFIQWTRCDRLQVLTAEELLQGKGNSGLDIAQFTKVVAAQYPWKDGAPTTNGWVTDIKLHHRIGGITERWFWTVLARNVIIELRRIANYRAGQVQPDFYTTDRTILDLFLGEFGTDGSGFNINDIKARVIELLSSEAYVEDLSAIANTENFISSRSIRGLLVKLHNGMTESIRNGMLDADGNIVNYSLRNEIVQVTSRLTIRYRGGI